MIIKKDYYLREVAGIHVVVALGAENRRFGGILKLNATAAFLFGVFEKGCQPEDAARMLIKRYGIGQSEAEEAVASFVADLKRFDLLDDVA